MKHKWMASLTLFAAVIGVVYGASPSRAASEIVVAIRYLQATGTSHAHLYLYREDGKLLRQLTKDNSGQDINPVFAPDGETIVFTREKPNNVPEYWTVRPLGSGLQRLKVAPAWYKMAKSSSYFTNIDTSVTTSAGPPQYRSPDGAIAITLRILPNDPDGDIDGPGHGKNFLIRDLRQGEEKEAGKLPGFEGLYDLLQVRQKPEQHFLIENGFRLAFFGLHLDSTAGDTAYALNVSGLASEWRLTRLSPNWAAPFPLPGEAAFLTLTEVRYVPIAGSTKTANSSYVERWDKNLRKIRYARSGAALVYGASLYRPGRKPAVVTIQRGN